VWINSYGTQREMRSKSLPSGQTSFMGGMFVHSGQKRSPCQAGTGGRCREVGLIQIQGTGGAGARTAKDMEVDQGRFDGALIRRHRSGCLLI
jgi:hypothetical protein